MASQNTAQQEQKQKIARTENYAKQVKREYANAVNDLLALNKKLPKLKKGEMYSFDAQNSKLRTEVSQVLRRLHATTLATIQTGVSQEWDKANKAMDKLLAKQLGKDVLKEPELAAWFDRNEQALKAFKKRSDYGMNLSDRLWKNGQQFRDEMEIAMTIAIGEGQSASDMSRRVRKYLDDPDLMFRRFRYKDDNGKWQRKWKKKVIDADGKYHFIDYDKDSYKVGAGVYKSAYKNAMRLTRTETNMAYREADHQRWQDMDLVLGQKIETSGSHTKKDKDICDELAGEYPKDFKFDGWHPQCYCICTPILTSEEDMEAEMQAALEGKPYTPKRKPITKYPKGFRDFLTNNKEALQKAISKGRAPYFIKNNMAICDALFNGEEPPVTINVPTAPIQEPKEKPFKPLTFEELKTKGWNITGNSSKYFYPRSKAYKINFEEFTDELKTIAKNYGFSINSFKLDIKSKDEFEMSLKSKKKDFEIVRNFSNDKEGKFIVNHELFNLSEELQGHGISKAIFRAFYKQYLNMGVDRIEVYANIDVGGYTWARYGFKTNGDKVRNLVNKTADTQLRKEGQAIIDEFYKGKSEDTLFPMNLLVEKLGSLKAKQLLKGKSWSGTLDLKDTAQREVFEKYMGYKGQQSAMPAQSQPKKEQNPQLTKEQRRQATLQKAQERHKARTQEQEKAIKDAWKKRQEKHAAIKADANAALSLASQYKEISSKELQELVNDNNLTKLPAATKKVQTAIAKSQKQEQDLSDLIPDVHFWHKEFTIKELQQAYDNVKKKLDYLANLPLETQLKKLNFEIDEYFGKNMNDCQNKYPAWKVSQAAYKKKLGEVDLALKYEKLQNSLKDIDVYLQAHPKATKMVDQYNQIQDWLSKGKDYDDIKKEFDILNDTYKRRVASEKSRAKKNAGSTQGAGPFTSDAYTKERKDKALWDTSSDKKKSLDTLHPEACKAWTAATNAEKDAVYEYTRTYCWTNEPLQGRKYNGNNYQSRAQFEERVKNIESYIERNELPCDMWFQRGDRSLSVIESRLKFRDPNAKMPSDFQALVGMEIQEGGFMSTASNKGGGFSSYNVILNVYAPKGTKAAYVEPFSYYGAYGAGDKRGWDGKTKQRKVGSENETLFQRGTVMRITNIAYSRGKYYIDVEVVGQQRKDLSYVKDAHI